ncbi:ribosome-releasing factor 2, mitochondrial-like [Liolophura sinensis]|uniref:ribosome-releasing factor 2, mitochondrial-like n=1 Tax=Liolophura sinensis TaxID=3198878 RepID=UPI0031593A81
MEICRFICVRSNQGLFPWGHVNRKLNASCRRWIQTKLPDKSLGDHHNFPKHVHKSDDLSLIRNIGIMAHIDAGKTTTTERMLFYSGFTRHLGDVDDGDTVMDYMEQERARGITITSAAITFTWKHHKINLIDTPGHVDFTFEVERSLRAIDGAVTILDASAGVEAQTLTVWRQADRYDVPRIIYLNKMDKPGASLDLCLMSIMEKLKVTPLLLQLPVGSEKHFQGIIDLVTMETCIWSKGNMGDGTEFKLSPIVQSADSSVWEKCIKARTSLIGQLADMDDGIADLVLKDVAVENIPVSDLLSALKRVTLARKGVPVLLGSSLKNKGVQHLLDGVNHYLPCPSDRHYPFAELYGEDLCALAFKITHEKQRGALIFLRLYSGSLKTGSSIYNVTRKTSEKVTRLLQVYADMHKDINHIHAGNIVCVTGLKQTVTGDLLTSSHTSYKKAVESYGKQNIDNLPGRSAESSSHDDQGDEEHEDNHFFSAQLTVPDPVFFCSIEPPSMAFQKDLDIALENLQREDNSLHVSVDKDTGQTILAGMGELHMEVIKERILKEYGIEVEMGPLQVAYKETITESSEVTERLDKTLGDRHHFVSMTLSVHPNQTGQDFKAVELRHSRENNLEAIRHHHLQAVNSGIKMGLCAGPILSFPVCGLGVYLHSLEIQPGTSMAMISACASQAVHKAVHSAAAVLLEPTMHLEITTDEDYLHFVMSDLAQRRSHIQGVEAREQVRVVKAITPLSEMMGYSTVLRSITSGTAFFSMELAQYEVMSLSEQNKVLQKLTGFLPS